MTVAIGPAPTAGSVRSNSMASVTRRAISGADNTAAKAPKDTAKANSNEPNKKTMAKKATAPEIKPKITPNSVSLTKYVLKLAFPILKFLV